ncbi:MAG TPA: 4-(cytidine 5'-diphospho)-2-C-methyl-D-erythritol kinase, partial [Acidimicrobiia bacterium]|nr:4-(cytidine 5'-diphospho)-2-C-methyl-D-erythritol kinase [Acidimicrobiia bacterium]
SGALADLGARLGSDVPFCVTGGAAWMRGRGEIVEPLPALPAASLPLVIAIPPFGLSTPAVYAAWDRLGGPRSTRACPAPPALGGLVDALVNDLEPAAEAVEPRLRPFREALERVAAAPAVLAGSGSAYAVPVASCGRAGTLAQEVSAELGVVAFATRPAEAGVALGSRNA